MSILGGFSDEAFDEYQRLAAEKAGVDFSEGEVYDFTRCMRSDGSFYGTRGSCRKGSQAGAKEKEEPKTEGGKKRRATVEAKNAAAAERKAAGSAKRSEHARRTRLFKEELEKVRGQMRGADDNTRNRLMQEASDRANKRHSAGEDVAAKPAKPAAEKPARKPRATVAETKPKWQESERAVVDAKKKFRDAVRETKGDKSPEARKRRLEAGRALDRAERAAEKASRRYETAMKRESDAKMTPEQRKQEREMRATKKRLG